MKIPIYRPDSSFTDEKWKLVESYISEQWTRSVRARTDQVESKLESWTKNYYGIPRETVRTVPWYKSSNVVVKVIRIFVDTFVARTLNMIYATQPLYTCEAFPREYREALQYYLNRKAMGQWQHYTLGRDMLFGGNREGTAVIKTPYITESDYIISSGEDGSIEEREVMTYDGPRSSVIPFDDFFVYPITASSMEQVDIKFHRIRYTEERARGVSAGWRVNWDELKDAIKYPKDVSRESERSEAGLSDSFLKELQVVETHMKWAMGSDESRMYKVVGLFIPDANKLVDLYFYPMPTEIFHRYAPFPRNNLFFGESMAEVLDQIQEEISQIHNDRRNASFIASAPIFKRRQGSRVPNPSTTWYPGKVWDLEDMDDLQVEMLGRNIGDLLAEENHVLMYGERLSGLGSIMQGQASGAIGKRGVYNTGGVMAILGESNQRQDTNIRDARMVMGEIARTNLILQLKFGADDPMINYLPRDMQTQVHQALSQLSVDALRHFPFEAKASTAAVNKETERQALLALQPIMGQFAQLSQQLVQLALDPKLNPGLRVLVNDILKMQRWLAARLLRSFDEQDVESVLPNPAAAIETGLPGGSKGSEATGFGAGSAGMVPGGPGGVPPMADRAALEALATLPVQNGIGSILPSLEGGQGEFGFPAG